MFRQMSKGTKPNEETSPSKLNQKNTQHFLDYVQGYHDNNRRARALNTKRKFVMNKFVEDQVQSPEYLLDVALVMMDKPAAQRTQEELQIIMKATQDLDFFKKLNAKKTNVDLQLHMKCCRCLKHVVFKKGQTVFYYGDPADKFYLILRGSANLYMPKSDQIVTKKEHRSTVEKDDEETRKYIDWVMGGSKRQPVVQSILANAIKEAAAAIQKEAATTTSLLKPLIKIEMETLAPPPMPKLRKFTPIIQGKNKKKEEAQKLADDEVKIDLGGQTAPTEGVPMVGLKKFLLGIETAMQQERNQKGKGNAVSHDGGGAGFNVMNFLLRMDEHLFGGGLLGRKRGEHPEGEYDNEESFYRKKEAENEGDNRTVNESQMNSEVHSEENNNEDGKSIAVPEDKPVKSMIEEVSISEFSEKVSERPESPRTNNGGHTTRANPIKAFLDVIKPEEAKKKLGWLTGRKMKTETEIPALRAKIPIPTVQEAPEPDTDMKGPMSRYFVRMKERGDENKKKPENLNWEQREKLKQFQALLGGLSLVDMDNPYYFFRKKQLIFNHISTLKAGDIFGELGLMKKKPRLATIVAAEETHMAVMDKNDYINILMARQVRKLEKKVDFFQKNVFNNVSVSRDVITKVSYFFKKKLFIRGVQLFSQGDEVKELYLVKSGLVKLTKTIQLGKANAHSFNSVDDIIKSINDILPSHNQTRTTQLTVNVQTAGEFVGIEDIFNKAHNYTAVVDSEEVSIFAISIQDLFKAFADRPEVKKLFEQNGKLKETWNQKMIQTSEQIVKRQHSVFPLESNPVPSPTPSTAAKPSVLRSHGQSPPTSHREGNHEGPNDFQPRVENERSRYRELVERVEAEEYIFNKLGKMPGAEGNGIMQLFNNPEKRPRKLPEGSKIKLHPTKLQTMRPPQLQEDKIVSGSHLTVPQTVWTPTLSNNSYLNHAQQVKGRLSNAIPSSNNSQELLQSWVKNFPLQDSRTSGDRDNKTSHLERRRFLSPSNEEPQDRAPVISPQEMLVVKSLGEEKSKMISTARATTSNTFFQLTTPRFLAHPVKNQDAKCPISQISLGCVKAPQCLPPESKSNEKVDHEVRLQDSIHKIIKSMDRVKRAEDRKHSLPQLKVPGSDDQWNYLSHLVQEVKVRALNSTRNAPRKNECLIPNIHIAAITSPIKFPMATRQQNRKPVKIK